MFDILAFSMTLETEEDRERVAQLYEKHKLMMYAVVGNILHEEKDVEDCFGETLVYILENWDDYSKKSPEHQFYYLKKSCINRAINMAKRKNRQNEREVSTYDSDREEFIDIPDNSPSIEDDLITQENIKVIDKLFSELPTADQDLLYFLNTTVLTRDEIGKMFGISKGAVGTRIYRIRKTLKDKWGEEI